MVNDHPNDVAVLGDAKRCFNVIDIIADAVKMIQSIPGKISCFIFGNCDSDGGDDNEDNDGDGDEDSINSSDDEEDEDDENEDNIDDDPDE